MQLAESLTSESPRIRRHLGVLSAIATLTVAMSVIIWLHPTLGYAQGGILDGADLRSSLLAILWSLFAAFCLASSAVMRVLPTRVRDGVAYKASYAIGAATAVLFVPILDKFV